jgi:hypothetical protein
MNQNEQNSVSQKTEIDETVMTREAAVLMKRKPQTLRVWASYQRGPIKPIRINGRLHWRLKDIANLLGGH